MKYPPYTDEQVDNARWCWFTIAGCIFFGVAIETENNYWDCFWQRSWEYCPNVYPGSTARQVGQYDVAFDSEQGLLSLAQRVEVWGEARAVYARQIQRECKERMGDGK